MANKRKRIHRTPPQHAKKSVAPKIPAIQQAKILQMAAAGKSLQTQEATTEREIGDKPENSQVVFRSCRRRHMQWPRRLRESSPKPDAANPHVRFDERGVETEAWRS